VSSLVIINAQPDLDKLPFSNLTRSGSITFFFKEVAGSGVQTKQIGEGMYYTLVGMIYHLSNQIKDFKYKFARYPTSEYLANGKNGTAVPFKKKRVAVHWEEPKMFSF